jgi:hypothetical protein
MLLMTSRSAWLLAALVGTSACSGEDTTLALDEPLRVEGAQFFEGDLPGLPPQTADDVIAGTPPTLPNVGSISSASGLIRQGEPGRTISGLASDDSAAVAVRFDGVGSGYWLVPTRSLDALNPGQVEWRLKASLGLNIDAGLHRLLFAAIDTKGNSGTQGALRLCVTPEITDNGNACDPSVSPPALVVSLGWSEPVDLDLRIITPSGKIVDSKHASTALENEDGDFDPSEPGTGVFEPDGYAHCRADGRRRESLVFQDAPPAGTYLIYANLYDACGEDTVHFNVSMHTAVPGTEPDTFEARQTFTQPGQLQAVHANGGTKLGLFLTSFVAH